MLSSGKNKRQGSKNCLGLYYSLVFYQRVINNLEYFYWKERIILLIGYESPVTPVLEKIPCLAYGTSTVTGALTDLFNL